MTRKALGTLLAWAVYFFLEQTIEATSEEYPSTFRQRIGHEKRNRISVQSLILPEFYPWAV
jgi:hypothetical protein